jgi:tetratricopeptide (TPR) repeat protein
MPPSVSFSRQLFPGRSRETSGPPYNLDMRNKAVPVLLWEVLVLGLLSAFTQSNSTPTQQIESHNRQAAEYLKQNRPDLAVPEFQAILALDPNNVDAHGNLGTVLFFQGNYADAIPQLRAALKLRPTLWKTQALLGTGEKRTGDLEAARRDLDKAFPNLTQEKIQIETGMELIELYSATGDLDKAGATVTTLRKVAPTNEAILYSAYRIYSDLADESLLSLSVVDPNSARMNQALAHELAKRGNSKEAIERYRAALKIDPGLPGIHFELAEMLRTLSTPEGLQEAESEYKAALQANPLDEQSECRLGDIAAQAHDDKAAYELYSKALQLKPNDPEANIGMAKVLMSMNQPEKAEQLLHHALELDPTSAVAHFRLGTIYRQTGRTAEAKNELDEYKKYREMKDKLRGIYQDLHRDQAPEDEDSNPDR